MACFPNDSGRTAETPLSASCLERARVSSPYPGLCCCFSSSRTHAPSRRVQRLKDDKLEVHPEMCASSFFSSFKNCALAASLDASAVQAVPSPAATCSSFSLS